jgi:STE24 endopeptidase
VGSIVTWILYAIIRRSPRRWWFYFWLAVIPISAFLTFISPAVIEPMFNKYKPLEQTHPELVTALEQVIHRTGLTIPPDRMYEMIASAKVTGPNAYVTGFGATKRVVVWDTSIREMTTSQLMFVFGHELGHYVLNHIVKGFVFGVAVFFILFYLGYRVARWMVGRWGAQWGIRGLDDWASLPLLVLIISALAFLSSPGLNAYSRYLEHQADQFGLEVIHGLVPNSPEVAAQSFQILGEQWLDYPYPSKFAVFWDWNHPPIGERVHYALSYRPWDEGKNPEFVR